MVGLDTALVSNCLAFLASGKKPRAITATPMIIKTMHTGNRLMSDTDIIILTAIPSQHAMKIATNGWMNMVTLTRVPPGVATMWPHTIGKNELRRRLSRCIRNDPSLTFPMNGGFASSDPHHGTETLTSGAHYCSQPLNNYTSRRIDIHLKAGDGHIECAVL